jgi:hypothetical protein
MRFFEANLIDWWNDLPKLTQFQLMQSVESADFEPFAIRSIEHYMIGRTPNEVLYDLQHDLIGLKFIKKWQNFTDDTLDFSFTHLKDDHFWNHSYAEVLTDIFLSSSEWFEKLSTIREVPEPEHLKIMYEKSKVPAGGNSLLSRMEFKIGFLILLMLIHFWILQPIIYGVAFRYGEVTTEGGGFLMYFLRWLSPIALPLALMAFFGPLFVALDRIFKEDIKPGLWILSIGNLAFIGYSLLNGQLKFNDAFNSIYSILLIVHLLLSFLFTLRRRLD